MRAFPILLAFSALMSMPIPALAAQAPSGEASIVAELRAAVAELRATLLRPGERVAGWDRGGADPESELRATGAEDHYFLKSGPDGDSVNILTDRPITAFAPAGWRVADSYGRADERLDRPQIEFVQVTDRYVLASRANGRRRNDADCFDPISHALLYEIPGAPARPEDETVPITFRLVILALEDQTVCIRSDGNREQGWRLRAILPDGRLLPEMTDPEEVMRIVPAAPIDRLVTIAPPQPMDRQGRR